MGIASGELTKIEECCFFVDYLQGHVVFVLRVMKYMCVVRLSDGYMRGWRGLLGKNIFWEVIIMRSTPVMWPDLNLLTQTVSGCLINWWNNFCQDYGVTGLWKNTFFLTEILQFIQLYGIAFTNSVRPTRRHIYPHMHTKYAFQHMILNRLDPSVIVPMLAGPIDK